MHVKACGGHNTVEEYMNLHVLQWATPQGKVLQDKVCLAGPAVTAGDANQPVTRHFISGCLNIFAMKIRAHSL